MKTLISILIVVGLAVGGWQFYNYYNSFSKQETAQSSLAQTDATQLPGMPSSLEQTLLNAQQHGAVGLRNFLQTYGRSIRDPRLGWIQLDYVLLVAKSDLAEARRVFAQVKKRTPENSPLYQRIKGLEKTFE